MRTVVPFSSESLLTTYTIHPNLLDDDDVTLSAYVSVALERMFSAIALSLQFRCPAFCPS